MTPVRDGKQNRDIQQMERFQKDLFAASRNGLDFHVGFLCGTKLRCGSSNGR